MPIRAMRVEGVKGTLDSLLALSTAVRQGAQAGVRAAGVVVRDEAREGAPVSAAPRRRRGRRARRPRNRRVGPNVYRRRGALRRTIRRAAPSRNREIRKAQNRLHVRISSDRAVTIVYPLVFYALFLERGTRRRRRKGSGRTWRGVRRRPVLRPAAVRSEGAALRAYRDKLSEQLRAVVQARRGGAQR